MKIYIKTLYILICTLALSCNRAIAVEMKLWYDTPAKNWMTSALPIGNGELGAMFFGGINREQIQFNVKSLWTGSKESRGAYQNFGDVFIDFEKIDSSQVENYHRELSLNEAIGRVSYNYRGIIYKREYLASYTDKIIAVNISTPGNKGKLNMSVSIKDAHNAITQTMGSSTLIIKKRLDILSYEAQLKVINKGGKSVTDNGKITIKGADDITLLLTGDTNFDLESVSYIGETEEELHKRINKRIYHASRKGFDKLKKDHLNDYCPLFNRVEFNLEEAIPDITTDKLVINHNSSLYLDMLYFQYGRYLMIASSRGMDLPSNLQGIWNNNNNPPWKCDIHSNINVQMNYWPAEICNLSECHMPFLNYIFKEAMKENGSWRKIAKNEGHRGWTIKTQNNIFGYSDWNINRPANAWYCMHLWQHFLYTQNLDFLSKQAFPIMKSACEYWFDRLKTDENNRLIAPDEWSPEQGPWEDGVAYAQQLIFQLFSETTEAIKILELHNIKTNKKFKDELSDKLNRLDKGLSIGEWGQIKEWKKDIQSLDKPGNQHRHLSQLIALYPGNQISDFKNHIYAEAARKTLSSRGDFGTGWSRAWKIACWARLLDGNHAYRLLKSALTPSYMTVISMDNDKGGIYENLLDSHPPFQIDGNFGATAGIAEMLLQSHDGFINLLPALPKEWKKGYIKGLKAIGNFTINIKWNQNTIEKCSLESYSGNVCKIYSHNKSIISVKDSYGKNIDIREYKNGFYSFKTNKNRVYYITWKNN